MDRRPGGLLPIGLLAFGAVVYSVLPGGSSGAGKSPNSPASAVLAQSQPTAPSSVNEDPLQILDDFLDAKLGRGATPRPTPRNLSTRLDEALHSRPGEAQSREPADKSDSPKAAREYHVTFLVATVPDPIDSHLVQGFDRAVGAIQRGVEQDSYVLDRLFLPWKKDTETRWNVNANPSDSDSFLTVSPKSAAGNLHRRRPGSLLFRGRQKPEELLIVYLVGETPTSGIQREAMSAALDAIGNCHWRKARGIQGCEDGQIRILSPFFSGSTESLRNSLSLRKEVFTIVSGSATVEDNKSVLKSASNVSSYSATVLSDKTLQRTFYKFLHDRFEPNRPGAVALFYESGTVYGSSARPTPRPSPSAGPTNTKPGPTPNGPRESHTGSDSENLLEFWIPFPLHVSQLRGAYEKDTALKNEGFFNRGPRHALELPLEAPEQNPGDILPPQDPKMTANVADLVLASGIETIRREKIHFVGIVASDTRDILFIARKIRESDASVTLFTFGSDILFTHPDYERYLRGMLIITPYPLFSPNQQWTGAGPLRMSFSGSSEQGIYNAVLALVPRDTGEMSSLLEYHSPLADERERPPVWVMAVGRNGFWPVWLTSDYEDKIGYVYSPPASDPRTAVQPPKERPPGAVLAFVIIEVIFSLILLSYGGARLQLLRGSPWLSEIIGTKARIFGGINRHADILFSNWSNRNARGIHQVYLGTGFFVFGLVQTAVWTHLFAVRRLIPTRSPWVVVALVFFAAILAVAFWLAAMREFVVHYREVRSKFRLVVVLGVPLALAFPLGRYLYEIVTLPSPEVLALYGRVLDFASTVTPALPFLLGFAVVIFWVITNIQRAFLLEIHAEARPPGESRLTSLEGIRPIQSSMERLLDDPATRVIALLGPFLLLVPFYRVLAWREYHTIDGARWSLLFEVMLLVCYFVIMYSVTLFLLLCLGLRRLLKRLASHPVALGFQRLPDSVATTPWKMWSALPSLAVHSASVSQLRALANLARGEGPDATQGRLSVLADLADQQMAKALRNDAIGLTATLPFRRALRRIMGSAMVTVLAALEVEWSKWPRSAGPVEVPEKKAEEQQTLNTPAWIRTRTPSGPEIWIRTAEEFVALRMSVFIRHVFLQMRNLLSFAFVGFLLALMAINSYPFEPKRLVMALVWFVALVTIPTVAWVFVKMDRDPILSFIGKTKPGRVTLSVELVTSMLIYVVVPLVTLFATQFPGVGDIVFSIFSPTVKSLGK